MATDPPPTGTLQFPLTRRYTDIFFIYLKHRNSIARVTLWGLDDGHSWLNNFPIRGRTNHPLLFDRKLQQKPAVAALLALAKSTLP